MDRCGDSHCVWNSSERARFSIRKVLQVARVKKCGHSGGSVSEAMNPWHVRLVYLEKRPQKTLCGF